MQYEAYMQQAPAMPTMQQPAQELPAVGKKRKKSRLARAAGSSGRCFWRW